MTRSEFSVSSEKQTAAFAEHLARVIADAARTHGIIVGLGGELGSGKTTFTRHLAAAVGAVTPVSSPTFVLGHEYKCADGLLIEHWDLYRVRGAGPEELLEGQKAGILRIIEWIDKDAELLHAADCVIRFDIISSVERKISVEISAASPVRQGIAGVVKRTIRGS